MSIEKETKQKISINKILSSGGSWSSTDSGEQQTEINP